MSGGVGGSDWHAGTVLFLSSFGARTLKALSYAPLIVQAGSKVRATFCPNVLLFTLMIDMGRSGKGCLGWNPGRRLAGRCAMTFLAVSRHLYGLRQSQVSCHSWQSGQVQGGVSRGVILVGVCRLPYPFVSLHSLAGLLACTF